MPLQISKIDEKQSSEGNLPVKKVDMVSFNSFPWMAVYILLNFALFWDGWHIRFKHKFKSVFTNVWTTSNTDID